MDSASQVCRTDLTSAAGTAAQDNRPYLLLDVREETDFDLSHIATAQNYPISRLARSLNFESKAMLKFKVFKTKTYMHGLCITFFVSQIQNCEGKIIVCYDTDEMVAARVATTLVQRGYDNVFMLSGGLKVAQITFPDGLIKSSNASSRNSSM